MRTTSKRGATLIDALLASALLLIVFLGIFGAFQLAIELVSANKAKVGAVALANEQMELIRSLSYDDVGTVGGIPSGGLAQTENISLNNSDFTRRTLIQYVDAPEDGEGADDENGITADYKRVKVEIAWTQRGGARTYSLVTNIVPNGIETLEGGGTLVLTAIDSFGLPIGNASVRIVNTQTNPTIDVTSFTNTNGKVLFPGSPDASSYEITVSKAGYSSAQTYDADTANPNPSPGHLTVSEGQTTNASFAIDTVGTLTVRTWEPIGPGTWTDTFASETSLNETTDTEVVEGALTLADPGSGYPSTGEAYSIVIGPAFLSSWNELSWNETVPADTSITYRLYYMDDQAGRTIIPDADLPGNSAGFTTGPVDISGLSLDPYDNLIIHGMLNTNDASTTPEVLDWSASYLAGPTPLPNISFTVTGAKTIGTTGGGAPIYKYEATHSSGSASSETLEAMEWDTYTISVDDNAIGYDISESCSPQPISLAPGESETVNLYFVADTTHSLLVDVTDSNGNPVEDATVRLTRTGFDETSTTGNCGQTFWEGLGQGIVQGGNEYTVEVSKSGFLDESTPADVSGASRISVSLSSL